MVGIYNYKNLMGMPHDVHVVGRHKELVRVKLLQDKVLSVPPVQ